MESDSVSESKRALREELSKDAETRWKERAENAARARAARGQACPHCTCTASERALDALQARCSQALLYFYSTGCLGERGTRMCCSCSYTVVPFANFVLQQQQRVLAAQHLSHCAGHRYRHHGQGARSTWQVA